MTDTIDIEDHKKEKDETITPIDKISLQKEKNRHQTIVNPVCQGMTQSCLADLQSNGCRPKARIACGPGGIRQQECRYGTYHQYHAARCLGQHLATSDPGRGTNGFDGRAQGYLAAVRAFDDAPGPVTYNAIIAGCISCHSVSCGGPLDFIDSMKW
jgi:hypothetical protein